MTRQDFLQKLSLGAAFVLTVPCLHSCGDDEADPGMTAPPAGGVDLSIDLTDATVAADLDRLGFTVVEKVVVARLADGSGFAAASQVCSHQAFETIEYDPQVDRWICLTHGAEFAIPDGRVLEDPSTGPLSSPLVIYAVEREGDVLRVTG